MANGRADANGGAAVEAVDDNGPLDPTDPFSALNTALSLTPSPIICAHVVSSQRMG